MVEQNGGDLGECTAVDDERRHLALGNDCKKFRLRVSFRANDNGFASNGAPTSCKAKCAAIELDPGAK
jgi:hypothetical protein